MDKITCNHCSKSYKKDSLRKSCGNCFLCTGCEIYICKNCQKEIVVTPMDIGNYNKLVSGEGE